MFDSIIIGAGPSGVECAITLKRANLNILVLYLKNESSLMNAKIENYYGFLSISGKTLYENGIKQLENLHIPLKNEEVIDLDFLDHFYVKTLNGIYESKTLVVASGIKNELPNIYSKYLGRGVSLCAHCDMPLRRGQLINLTGFNPYLNELINDTILYTKDYKIYDYNLITGTFGEDSLQGIIYDNQKIELNNLFLALPISSESMYSKLGVFINDNKKIIVDDSYMTNIKGLYAIGDISSTFNQVSTSVYSGFISALKIIKDLKK